MGTLVFTCPDMKLDVQQWFDDKATLPENEYVSVPCPACTKLHLLNLKTGKLLGQDSRRQ